MNVFIFSYRFCSRAFCNAAESTPQTTESSQQHQQLNHRRLDAEWGLPQNDADVVEDNTVVMTTEQFVGRLKFDSGQVTQVFFTLKINPESSGLWIILVFV